MTFDLQVAVIELLRGDERIAARVRERVYDDVPAQLKPAMFPFIAWGEDDDEADDDKTGEGLDARFRLHVWSRYKGKAEAKRIIADTRAVLHHRPGRLHVSGWQVVEVDFLRSNLVLDADGLTRHGMAEFRALLHKING